MLIKASVVNKSMCVYFLIGFGFEAAGSSRLNSNTVTAGGWSEKPSQHDTNWVPASLKDTLRTEPVWAYDIKSTPVSISHNMTF
jgi:hypothetical protein